MSPASFDRRRVARYTVRVPVRVHEIGLGSTVNLSATGIAFLVDRAVDPGDEIHFELRLEDAFLLHCVGRVVRVESRGNQSLTAATIDDMSVGSRTEH